MIAIGIVIGIMKCVGKRCSRDTVIPLELLNRDVNKNDRASPVDVRSYPEKALGSNTRKLAFGTYSNPAHKPVSFQYESSQHSGTRMYTLTVYFLQEAGFENPLPAVSMAKECWQNR